MNYPGLENLTPQMVFDRYNQKEPKNGYSLAQVQAVFNNRAFQENPYRFVLEDLIDHSHLSFSVREVPTRVLMLGLPQFKKKATMKLVREIAQDRFKYNEALSQMMEIFNCSKHSETFLMHFEYYRNHAKTFKLSDLLKELFAGMKNLKPFIITEEYLDIRDNANE